MNVSDYTLRALHIGASVAHLVQFGYGEALVNSIYKDRGFFTLANPVATPPGSATSVETNPIATYQLTQLVPIFSLLSTMNHAWSAIDFKNYLSFVDRGYNPVRWSEYAISAGLMNWVVAQLSGVNDIKTLLFLVSANAALQFTGYSIEKDTGRSLQSRNKFEAQNLFQAAGRQQVIGFAVFLSELIPIWIAFFTSLLQTRQDSDDSEIPAFVWAVIFVITALYLVFGIVSLYYFRGADRRETKQGFLAFRERNFRLIEVGYLILSLVAKTFLMNITLFGSTQSRT